MKKNNLIVICSIAGVIIVSVIFYFIKNSSDLTPPVLSPGEMDPSQNTNTADFGKLQYPLEINEVDLAYLLAQNKPVIIDFGADSCVPCREMAPVLKKLNAEMQEIAVIQFVDVWKNQKAIGNFPIQVIPTQIFFTADRKPYKPSPSIQISFDFYGFDDSDEIVFTVHQGGLTEDQMRLIIEDMLKQGGA